MRYHSPKYRAYLQSRKWQVKREFALYRAGYRCERCGSRSGLQVHHRTYDRLGNEQPADLEVVCQPCHRKADKERAWRVVEKQYDRALDTYASKKYGDDWDEWKDIDAVADEFDAWLERHEEE